LREGDLTQQGNTLDFMLNFNERRT